MRILRNRAGRGRLVQAATVVALVTVAVAGCGSGGGDDSSADAAGTATDAAAPGTGGSGRGDADDQQAAELAFYDCMRDHGVDLPDPDPNQPGVQLRLPETDDPAVEAAVEECSDLLPGGGPGAEQSDPEALAALREFTACMRDSGIDMADPGADGTLAMPDGVDPNSAEFQTAMDGCQHLLAGHGVRMRGGGGGQ